MKLPLNPSGHPSIRHPSGSSHHPSTESLTLQLSARVGVVGGWRGVFFFQVVFGVDSGQWTFHASFIWAQGGGFIFLSANGKAQSALLLFLLSLGGEKDFFSIFPYFPMCSHGVPSKFLMVPNVFPKFTMCFSTCSAYKHLTFIPYALTNVVLLSPVH